jgi:hypothetical protein
MNTTPHSPVVRPVALSSILAGIILAASLGLHAQPATAPAKKTAPALALTVDVSAAERVKPALPVIPDHTFNLADFGGVGDGQTMNTDAIDVGPGTNFWIHDCDIDTGDDDIVIKSGGTNILIENNTIEGARNAGIIHSLPDSPITNLTLQDITLTAEKDFDIRDAEKPVFERVTRTIKPGFAPAINPGEH